MKGFHIDGEMFFVRDADEFADVLNEKLGHEVADTFRYFLEDAEYEMQARVCQKFVEAAKDAIDDLDLEGLI